MNILFQKYTHVRLARQENPIPYYRSKLWWCGMLLMGIGEMGNFAAYGFAPATLIAPLGCVAVIGKSWHPDFEFSLLCICSSGCYSWLRKDRYTDMYPQVAFKAELQGNCYIHRHNAYEGALSAKGFVFLSIKCWDLHCTVTQQSPDWQWVGPVGTLVHKVDRTFPSGTEKIKMWQWFIHFYFRQKQKTNTFLALDTFY